MQNESVTRTDNIFLNNYDVNISSGNIMSDISDHFRSVLHLIKSNVRGVRKLYLCNLGTRKGYVALATHGRVALTLRMNGSDGM